MLGHVPNLVRWEWFKLRRRWMPWILLAIILFFTQMPIMGGFFEYKGIVTGEIRVDRSGGPAVHTGLTCADVRAGRMPEVPEDAEIYGEPALPAEVTRDITQRCAIESLAESKGVFTLPSSLLFPFGFGQLLVMLLLSILAASMLGTEYSWGTLRTVLVRGTGRWQYLAAKLAMIVLFAAGVWIVVGAATVLSSLVASALAPDSPPGVAAWLATYQPGWADTLTVVGRAFVAIIPYLALAVFVTVVTTSQAAGMAVSLGYYFAEAIGALLLINVIHAPRVVSDYLLVRNIAGWMLGSKDQVIDEWILRGPFGFGVYPSQVHAIIVISAYCLLFGVITFWLFMRRDVTGPSGG